MYDLFFELKEKYGELVANTLVLEVGSVRDEESLWRVMGKYKPDIVIHAAAHKHVPLMETSSEQAILNNVFGTYKTAKVAVECNVQRFVLISTDKAVNPTNGRLQAAGGDCDLFHSEEEHRVYGCALRQRPGLPRFRGSDL